MGVERQFSCWSFRQFYLSSHTPPVSLSHGLYLVGFCSRLRRQFPPSIEKFPLLKPKEDIAKFALTKKLLSDLRWIFLPSITINTCINCLRGVFICLLLFLNLQVIIAIIANWLRLEKSLFCTINGHSISAQHLRKEHQLNRHLLSLFIDWRNWYVF